MVPEKLKPAPENDSLAKLAKAIGWVALGLAAVGILANLHDIRRYVRMSTM